ncbi:uncharacterized protein TRIADDRAFT_59287 [Trichoplax adhaerens]|uniref:AAA+ ATPase domain-containing protein n=1 Tax=Trichoplax adhaerens TaxID=10228 RepID=B3S5D4_TRIAD|nr:hypothetical protein TRIADDRAFT_59287 [Trichoplax adhaerens]EDV22117.1 hypothetical protein TRIADDRAFT_59287 [Trichoplax adhaerens]|eukprot:XP_002115272.1 hypothetical protein TRIADDRAFT_59287 [Trichoplax adhaerens]
MAFQSLLGKEKTIGNSIIRPLVEIALGCTLAYVVGKWVYELADPTQRAKREAKEMAKNILKNIGLDSSNIKLSDYEMSIASHLVDPKSVNVSWEDIGGLDDVINEILETVVLPFRRQDLFVGSNLLKPPRGVLLYGNPGCGKTMIAKATARAAGCHFINLQISTLTDKWYGESQKLAAAVFSLAYKLQPVIIFVDEIDSFLRARSSNDHEATAMMKAQFMSLWDGLCSDESANIMILGATNRLADVDAAILRRMPARFHIPLPDLACRRQIIGKILKDEKLADDVVLDNIAQCSEGLSGSDLREVCRYAAACRVRDYVNQQENNQSDNILQRTKY